MTPAYAAAADAYFDALACSSSGDDASAKASLSEALQADPGFVPASIELGLVLLKGKDFVGAYPHLQAANAALGAFRAAHPEFGARTGDGRAVDIVAKGCAMHVGLAEIYRSRGDSQRQRAHLELRYG